jgi:hypothetical protein
VANLLERVQEGHQSDKVFAVANNEESASVCRTGGAHKLLR